VARKRRDVNFVPEVFQNSPARKRRDVILGPEVWAEISARKQHPLRGRAGVARR
jgi:hypothetical protein